MFFTSPNENVGDPQQDHFAKAAALPLARHSLLVAAGVTLGFLASPTSGFAQYGGVINGVVGAIVNQALQPQQPPPPQYYQPSPPPQGYYQPQPMPPGYQPAPGQPMPPQQVQPTAQQPVPQTGLPATAQQPLPQPVQPTVSNTNQYYDEDAELVRQKRAAAVAAAKKAAQTGKVTVAMKKSGGTFEVPARVNNAIVINFTVDSGASDVMIPADVVATLVKSGSLKQSDYIGDQTYTLADGSKLPSVRFKLASLQVGNQTLTDVVASVAPASGGALLGQSFLSRFASWTLDNTAGTLILTLPPPGTQLASTAPIVAPATPTTPPVTAAPTPAPTPAPAPANAGTPPADQTTPNKAASASAMPAGNLPAFADQTPYSEARDKLIAMGFAPGLSAEAQCDATKDKSCFPEREACFGSNVIQCNFSWKRGDTVVRVQTVNIPPTVAKVDCQTNCQ